MGINKIILDCDPGHDDALAILLALASPNEIKCLGLTISAGNVSLELTTKMHNKLEYLGVLSLLDKRTEQLSGGELQRVTLVRALMREKPILLLDEPFSALDKSMIKNASDLILGYTKETQSVTLIISHQDVSLHLNTSHKIELK